LQRASLAWQALRLVLNCPSQLEWWPLAELWMDLSPGSAALTQSLRR
jgi:hypothetical protein